MGADWIGDIAKRMLAVLILGIVAANSLVPLAHAQTFAENPVRPPTFTPTPTPTATPTPCFDFSRPLNGGCDSSYFKTLVSGSDRCVPNCGSGERAFNISCPITQSTVQCTNCSRDCSTCAFKKVEFENAGFDVNSGFDGDTRSVYSNVFQVINGAPSCITARYNENQTYWNSLASLSAGTIKYRDDKVATRVLASFNGIYPEIQHNTTPRSLFCQKTPLYDVGIAPYVSITPRFLRCTYRCPVGSPEDCQATGTCCTQATNRVVFSPRCHNYEGLCAEGYFFVDNNCNTVEVSSAEENVCQASLAAKISYVASSPISLAWTKGHDMLKSYSLVHFPLDLAGSDRWYAWYASADAPLLVYDPSHTGVIESAQQLFGNWTFGGQRSASVATDQAQSMPQPWKNGYEALATLDADGNGVISEGELAPLGLWFDANRDGISQAGEVKPLTRVGVTKLLTGPATAVSSTRAVKVAGGFVRETDSGEEIVGDTIDWYSEGASTMGELATRMDFVSRHTSSDSDNGAHAALPSPKIPWTMGEVVKDSPLNGRWAWSDPKDTEKLEHGVIAIAEHSDGGISGVALAQVNLETDLAMKGAVSFKVLKGVVTKRQEKTIDITFSTLDAQGDDGEPSVVSTASLDIGAGVLSGTTTQVVGEGASRKTVRYHWVSRSKTPLGNETKAGSAP